MDVIARDLAVEVVDAIHGYTMEFAGSPEAHRAEYDAAERIIARALNNQGAVEALRESLRLIQDDGLDDSDVVARVEVVVRNALSTAGGQ